MNFRICHPKILVIARRVVEKVVLSCFSVLAVMCVLYMESAGQRILANFYISMPTFKLCVLICLNIICCTVLVVVKRPFVEPYCADGATQLW